MNRQLGFLETIKYVFVSNELRKKLIFTVLMLIMFRIGANITIPGVTTSNQGGATPSGDSSQSLSSLLGMLGGGGLKQFSIFALGLSPYIMGTVIVQLLSSDIIPSWTRLAKSGELGRKKLDLYGRYITVFIGITQAYALTSAMSSSGSISFSGTSWFSSIYLVSILVGGSFFSLWIGDMISKKGLGNGTSLIIFTGVAANLPWNFYDIFNSLFNTSSLISVFSGLLDALFYIAIFAGLLIGTVFLNQSIRKIPVQGVGSGLK